MGEIKSVADYEAAVHRQFPKTAAEVLAAYPAKDVAARGGLRSTSVAMPPWACACPTGRAPRPSSARSPVFAYFFTRRQPYAPGITFIDHDPATAGAYHTGEVPYFLRTRESLNLFRQTRNWEPVDVDLEDDMSALLVSFARTGTPIPRACRNGRSSTRTPPGCLAGRADRRHRLAELRLVAVAGRTCAATAATYRPFPRTRLITTELADGRNFPR